MATLSNIPPVESLAGMSEEEPTLSGSGSSNFTYSPFSYPEKVAAAEALGSPIRAGEHPLESAWSFWFDKKFPNSLATIINYAENIKYIGSFNTVEGFWRYYTHMLRPDSFARDYDYYMFRDDDIPAWETWPFGGCWILKYRKRSGMLNKVWERLILAAIGEIFEEPNVCGVCVSTRQREDLISVWNKDNINPVVHFRIGERLEALLHAHTPAVIEYKAHSTSLQDRSTFRNARPYIVVPPGATSSPQAA